MIRFRNPGSNVRVHIEIVKELYNVFGENKFSLKDMETVLAKSHLLTSYGYSGDAALALNKDKSDSKNAPKMNAKMYAEIFRLLGFITPYNKDDSYPVILTYLGIHLATSKNPINLYEQCIFGMVNPTDLTDNMSYTENLRFVKCVVNSLMDLNEVMYKHELCLGPMSINDINENEYKSMISYIKSIRGQEINLKSAFEKLCKSLNMTHDSVDNTTRFPIRFLKDCNIIEEYKTDKLYGKKMVCFKITEHGKQLQENISQMKDLRLPEFKKYDLDIQKALIRIGIYTMLKNSGFDISEKQNQLDSDKILCSKILAGKELLFSPYQTIRRELIEEALDIKYEESNNNSSYTLNEIPISRVIADTNNVSLDYEYFIPKEFLSRPDVIELIQEIKNKKNEGFSNKNIVKYFLIKCSTQKQDKFYPFISAVFNILGFDCHHSRQGDNGSRWDAMIVDEKQSIPIEIKSPTEVETINIKAIEQALENKIILLSRKTFKTEKLTTSLAIGYKYPNERAEVSSLIDAIHKVYGYKIGVIDLETLLIIVVSIVINKKSFMKVNLYNLKGFLNASI